MVRPGVTFRAWIGESSLTRHSSAIVGRWLGRDQPLSGPEAYLGPEGRARWEAEAARERADREQMLADLRASF